MQRFCITTVNPQRLLINIGICFSKKPAATTGEHCAIIAFHGTYVRKQLKCALLKMGSVAPTRVRAPCGSLTPDKYDCFVQVNKMDECEEETLL